MDGKNLEVAKEVVALFRTKQMTVEEIREVLTEINAVLDSISVLK